MKQPQDDFLPVNDPVARAAGDERLADAIRYGDHAVENVLPLDRVKSRLTVVPCSFSEAREFIRVHHRHHVPPVGHKFSVAVADPIGAIRGVATIGRPVSRMLDNGWTLEVNRVATDGCDNACSALYGAAWRIARELGYRRLITYILGAEPGTSLRGAGWKCLGERGGGEWNCKSRPRVDKAPTQIKMLYEVTA